MLLEHGVDLDAKTFAGKTALEIAEASEREQSVRAIGQSSRPAKPFGEVAELLRRARG